MRRIRCIIYSYRLKFLSSRTLLDFHLERAFSAASRFCNSLLLQCICLVLNFVDCSKI